MSETNLPATAAHQAVASITYNEVRALVPATFDEVWRFSQVLAASGLTPYGMNTPEKVSVAILTGLEIGVKPMQAVQGIAVIGGRPCIWGDLALAIVRSSGELAAFKETYEGVEPDWTKPATQLTPEERSYKAVCTLKRKGYPDEMVSEFSVNDAIVGKLWHKKGHNGGDTPWVTSGKRMMKMRARGFNLRDGFADVMKGMMVAEEMIGSEEDDLPRTSAPVTKRRREIPDAPVAAIAKPADTSAFDNGGAGAEPAKENDAAEVKVAPAAAQSEAARKETTTGAASSETDETDEQSVEEIVSDLNDRLSHAKTPDEVEEAYTDFDPEPLVEKHEGAIDAVRKVKAEHLVRVTPAAAEKGEAPAAAETGGEPADPFVQPDAFDSDEHYNDWIVGMIGAVKNLETATALHAAWSNTKKERTALDMSENMVRRLKDAVTSAVKPFEKQRKEAAKAAEPKPDEPAAEKPATKPAEPAKETISADTVPTDSASYKAVWMARLDAASTFETVRGLKFALADAKESEVRSQIGVGRDVYTTLKTAIEEKLEPLRPANK